MDKRTRHGEILRILEAEDHADSVDLAERLGISDITVRRDFRELEAEGSLRRVHGGAIRATGRAQDRPFEVRQHTQTDAKAAIAAAAAELVVNGDAIALDVGSTIALMVDQLGHARDLTIVTASLRTAWAVANSRQLQRPVRLIVPGGVVADNELSLVGNSTIEHIRQLRVDMAFLGVGGLNTRAGLTDFNLDDAEVKRALVDSAKHIVVLADSTKLGAEQFVQVAEIGKVNQLITDPDADPSTVNELEQSGINVTIAQPKAPGS